MLTVTATNFGVAPESITLKSFESESLLIINSLIALDPTNEDYLKAGVLRLTVEGLPFRKSHETAVFALNRNDGSHDITLARAWIEKGTTLCIVPVYEYNSLTRYELLIAAAFIPENNAGTSSFAEHAICTPSITKGGLADADIQTVKTEDWAMLMLRSSALTWESDSIELNISELSGFSADLIPVIYTNSVSDTLGSKFYPATLQDGKLTVSKDGSADESSTAGYKFTKLFLLK